ncbi:MAG: 5,10-methylenetetrahydrofolate reductase [Deltaproteobacteria bacterium RBG_16_54_11]|jgi:methylenetetrahydrofolate reductase (NADPH)|nr:MAG: 5,10-methylenetetrahydrofolate reductase [Deltaproteobacteria bacterium RBG_16_54_11]
MKEESRLKNVLQGGHFAVTAECGPPKGADPKAIQKKGKMLKAFVDSVNVTDNQTGVVRLSSLAACALLLKDGLDPVLQMVTRDRNRIALQSDILGASALGIRNILCLSGDHQSFGNQPQAKGVFDIDSMQLIQLVRQMRDKGVILGGERLTEPPHLFVGAVENPFADPFSYRVLRLEKKVAAGAEFIQTQCVYNIVRFKEWMEQAGDCGIPEKVYILGGVTPLKSTRMAEYMSKQVAGMDVPDEIIKRMKSVPADKQREEGIRIAVETIQALKGMKGIHGVHIMAIEWEDVVPQLVEEAGLAPRPTV